MSEPFDESDYAEQRIDRSTFTVFKSFAEDDAARRAYWHSRTPEERLRHALHLRRLAYGSRVDEPFQRVFEIVERKTR
jgi:hypothetical protein